MKCLIQYHKEPARQTVNLVEKEHGELANSAFKKQAVHHR